MTKHVHLTWYRLVDGTQADPNDVSPGKDGILRHKNGLAVQLHSDGTPMSIGREANEGGANDAAEAGRDAAKEAKQQAADNAALAKAEVAPDKASDEDLLLTTDDLSPTEAREPDEPKPEEKKPAKASKPAKAKAYKNRELKAR